MSDYRHGSHTTFSIHLHIVWITKYRHKVVPVQVVKTSLTLQIAPSERLQEAETVQRHPAGPLRTPL